jgi:carbonic anhydrase/acetyltransferase-like protein (isoleucine patch superfamily)
MAVIHPQAYIAPGVRIGRGTFVSAGAVTQSDTSLGRHVIVNTSSSIDHDGVIDEVSLTAEPADAIELVEMDGLLDGMQIEADSQQHGSQRTGQDEGSGHRDNPF